MFDMGTCAAIKKMSIFDEITTLCTISEKNDKHVLHILLLHQVFP